MASVLSKLMTAEEFYDWCHREENRDRNFELERGVIVEVPLTERREGVICANAGWILGSFTRRIKMGHVCTNNVGIVLERNPDTVLGPDVALFLDRRKFQELDRGYATRLPALAVEVWASHDRHGKMLKRILKFINSGVPMVWLVDPEEETVTIYLPNQTPIVLEDDEEMTGQGVLPDFLCKASEFFAMPGE